LQIAPSAKKLWGLEAKDGKSLALNHLNHEGVWRDPTWAAPGMCCQYNFKVMMKCLFLQTVLSLHSVRENTKNSNDVINIRP